MGIGPAIKRAMDVSVATVLTVILSPVIAVVALLVRVTLGSPVLFRQERIGLKGHVFTIVKFRTMQMPVEAASAPAHDVLRSTPVGRWLRSTSLDELPELVNVVRGDMSLVGPRPLLTQYRDRYTPEQWRRHEMRPGLTGLAQVSGRNALTWPERFELDVWYVDHWTLRLDLKILWRTLVAVVRRAGISSPGAETMPEFMGEH